MICDLALPVGRAAESLPGQAVPPVIASFTLPEPKGDAEAPLAPALEGCAEVYAALTLGLRDYVDKNRFERVLVGVSGGIDSAAVALIAADALGPDRLTCVVMPSPHSSSETQADARAIAESLGSELIEIPIEAAMGVYEDLLPADGAAPGAADLAAENIQARIRGNLMMALSNRTGGSSSRRATRARCRSATRRSMATWPVALP